MFIHQGGKTVLHTFHEVRVVPGFRFTLLSMSQLEYEGAEMNFCAGERRLSYPDKTVISFERGSDRFYALNAYAAITKAGEQCLAVAGVAHGPREGARTHR